jgi:hypothetical protein
MVSRLAERFAAERLREAFARTPQFVASPIAEEAGPAASTSALLLTTSKQVSACKFSSPKHTSTSYCCTQILLRSPIVAALFQLASTIQIA